MEESNARQLDVPTLCCYEVLQTPIHRICNIMLCNYSTDMIIIKTILADVDNRSLFFHRSYIHLFPRDTSSSLDPKEIIDCTEDFYLYSGKSIKMHRYPSTLF